MYMYNDWAHLVLLTAVDNDYLKFLQINNIAIYNVW